MAALAEPEVKASLQDIARSLEGNWRDELLFVMGQQVELYRFYREQIAHCKGKKGLSVPLYGVHNE